MTRYLKSARPTVRIGLSPSVELATLIEANKTAQAEHARLKAIWMPYGAAREAAYYRTSDEARRQAMDAVEAPEILRVEPAGAYATHWEITFSDGAKEERDFSFASPHILGDLDAVTKRYGDQPEKLQEAKRALEAWSRQRFAAAQAITETPELVAARDASDRAAAPMRAAGVRAAAANAALWAYKPQNAADSLTYAEALLEDAGGGFRKGGAVGLSEDIDQGQDVRLLGVLFDALATLLTSDPAPCPVKPVMADARAVLERMYAAEQATRDARAAGHDDEAKEHGQEHARLSDRLDRLEDEAAQHQARSVEGAVFQLQIAATGADLAANATSREISEHEQDKTQRLIRSALMVIGRSDPLLAAHYAGIFPPVDEDILANSRPEDREPEALPFDPARAAAELRAAGVEIWPGVGWSFPNGLNREAQDLIAGLSQEQTTAILAIALSERHLDEVAHARAQAQREHA